MKRPGVRVSSEEPCRATLTPSSVMISPNHSGKKVNGQGPTRAQEEYQLSSESATPRYVYSGGKCPNSGRIAQPMRGDAIRSRAWATSDAVSVVVSVVGASLADCVATV